MALSNIFNNHVKDGKRREWTWTSTAFNKRLCRHGRPSAIGSQNLVEIIGKKRHSLDLELSLRQLINATQIPHANTFYCH